MRVLHVISDENIGGAGVLLSTLLSHFAPHVKSYVALPRGSALIERLDAEGLVICELEQACDRASVRSVREIARLIREHEIEIVHANAALAARLAGRICGVPVVHTRHCCYPPSGAWRLAPIRWIGGLGNRMLSSRVIATAEAAAENLRALGIPQKKIEVIINGSRPVREVDEQELNVCRVDWNIAKDAFTVGICARLERCKGHETFLEMARILRERSPKFKFLIVGEGSQRAALERLSRELGLDDCVTFTGFVGDMAPVYRLLRVNVNCSQGTETSCLALSEGMSAGVPAVVSDYGGNRAMIGESEAGFVVPMGDSCSFADAVWRIAQDAELERTMRAAAYERYLKHYTAQTMADRVMAVYESVLSR